MSVESNMLSMWDNDVYKFHMQELLFRLNINPTVKMSLINRNKDDLNVSFKEFESLIKHIASNRVSNTARSLYIANIDSGNPEYTKFLLNFKLNPDLVKFGDRNGEFYVDVEGPWQDVTLWEVPIMYAINEIQSRHFDTHIVSNNLVNITEELDEIKRYDHVRFADAGTRRRFNANFQYNIVRLQAALCPGNFTGTSNVVLASELGLSLKGSIPHEAFMGLALIVGYDKVSQFVHEKWYQNRSVNFGPRVAVTDTFTTKFFMDTTTYEFRNQMEVFKHDSGSLSDYENLISNYVEQPYRILCANGIKVSDLRRYYNNRKYICMIGTSMTNPINPLNIVVKLMEVDGKPTCKISDELGKMSGVVPEHLYTYIPSK